MKQTVADTLHEIVLQVIEKLSICLEYSLIGRFNCLLPRLGAPHLTSLSIHMAPDQAEDKRPNKTLFWGRLGRGLFFELRALRLVDLQVYHSASSMFLCAHHFREMYFTSCWVLHSGPPCSFVLHSVSPCFFGYSTQRLHVPLCLLPQGNVYHFMLSVAELQWQHGLQWDDLLPQRAGVDCALDALCRRVTAGPLDP